MSNLTAWERWELGSLDAAATPARAAAAKAGEVALPTADELEQIRELARKQGYDAGYAEGRDHMLAEAARLAAAATQLDRAFKGLEKEVANELLALAVAIGRQVIRGELVAHPAAVLDVVREALAQLPHVHAAIFLNPEDAALVRTHLGDQISHAGHRINDDPQLKRGDCVIEAGGSQVDATVATRWRRVVESLGLNAAWDPPAEG